MLHTLNTKHHLSKFLVRQNRDPRTVFNIVMCCPPAGFIQGNVMKIKRGSMTHSINLCLITSDPIISDADINTPMHG